MSTTTTEEAPQETPAPPEAPATPGALRLRLDAALEAMKEWTFSVGIFYFVSMAFHMTLIIVAGLLLGDAVAKPKSDAPAFDTALNTPPPQETTITPPQRLEEKIVPSQTLTPVQLAGGGQMGGGGGLGGIGAPGLGGAFASGVAGPKLGSAVGGTGTRRIGVDVGAMNLFSQSGGTLNSALPPGAIGDGLATVQGYGDAMDRITQEVLNVLAKDKTLVVWVMDQSESMADDREEISARIERVYTELGLSSAVKDDALLTGVVSYGAGTLNHTPKPTANSQEIMAAIKSVPNDPSGLEMQAQAIMFAANSYARIAHAGRRKMMLVLVTDESGDVDSNIAQTENAIALCRDLNTRVYVLGREAIFGYPYAHMHWVHKETKTSHWLRIDRGPETPQPEQLQINGFNRRHDAFPSGFGPYEQARIARQTGGIFFMLPSPEVKLVGRRADLVYDADVMRSYFPDLSARQDYITERDRSPFRKMIFQVISDLNPYQPGRSAQLEVRTHHFSIDRAQFATQATQEMKKAADLIGYLKQAQKALESVESLRDREKSTRWRADYDLIYAQTVSYQSRLQEFGWYLAEFQKTPKAVKNVLGPARPTNGWSIGLVKRLLKPDVTKEQRDYADRLFRKIQTDYPGTPWAARAAEELGRAYGVELQEMHDDQRGRAGITVPKI